MQVHAIYPVTMSADPAITARFYRELLDLTATFTSDWYESLRSPSGQQLATVARSHGSVPAAFAARPAGTLVTVEVDDADAVRARAAAMAAPIEMDVRDEDFGQRHFMTRDPDGLLVDVVQPIPPSPEFAALYDPAALPDADVA